MRVNQPSEPQTVVVSRRIKQGQESTFEQLSTDMTMAAANFSGHMGATMFRPYSADDPEYRIVFKFLDSHSLNNWLRSDVRLRYIEKINKLLIEPSSLEKHSGIATWFTLPDRSVARPPKYKLAIVSWMGLFPIVAIIFWLFGKWLDIIPLVPRVAFVTAVVMILMTWVAMPQLTKIFAPWLFPKKNNIRRS